MKNMYSETYQVTVADLGYYEKEKQIEILVNDHGDHFELKTVVDTVEFEAQADDMFSAFQLLRDKMLKMAWGIKCNAARINAVQSGMMRDLDVVYLVEMGKPARNPPEWMMFMVFGIIVKWRDMYTLQNKRHSGRSGLIA